MTHILIAIVILLAIWSSVRLLQVRSLGKRLMAVRALNSDKPRSTARG